MNTPNELDLTTLKNQAEQGNMDAQVLLGAYYMLCKDSPEEGKKWLQKAADQGNTKAQDLLNHLQ